MAITAITRGHGDLFSSPPLSLYSSFNHDLEGRTKGKLMRLGDDIDDHCSRCKRSTDHAVVAMAGEEVLKTRCRTCNSEHSYRRNQGRKKEMTAKEAYQKLVASMPGAQPAGDPEEPSAKKQKKS